MATINLDIAKTADIVIRAGDTLALIINVTNSDGELYDFSSYTALLQVKKSATDVTPVLTLSTDDESIVLEAGKIKLNKNLPNTLPAFRYIYDLQLTNTVTGIITTWLVGVFAVKQDVTRKND